MPCELVWALEASSFRRVDLGASELRLLLPSRRRVSWLSLGCTLVARLCEAKA